MLVHKRCWLIRKFSCEACISVHSKENEMNIWYQISQYAFIVCTSWQHLCLFVMRVRQKGDKKKNSGTVEMQLDKLLSAKGFCKELSASIVLLHGYPRASWTWPSWMCTAYGESVILLGAGDRSFFFFFFWQSTNGLVPGLLIHQVQPGAAEATVHCAAWIV